MGVERKLATALFVDLVDSTSFVTSSDPEIVRRQVDRFFEQASRCIESHGGLVEKFAGDAVMAVFGVPQAHEDDAERAVRAALEILEATSDLGLDARVGVEAGEVVVGEGDSTFATGEAINLAARLQQHASAGEIMIGPAAYRLTLDRIEVEDAGPVQVRGRKEPLWAWRAVRAFDAGPRALSLESPLVGREDELSLLENTFARAVKNRRAHLVTIFGGFLHLTHLRYFHFESKLHDVRRKHKDDQQHQHYIHQWNDVDFGNGTAAPKSAASPSGCSAIAAAECHAVNPRSCAQPGS